MSLRKKSVLNVSRLTLVVALITPFIVSHFSVPKSLPKIEYGDYIPLSEGSLNETKKLVQVEDTSATSSYQTSSSSVDLYSLVIIFFLMGILLKIAKLLRSLFSLRAMLAECVAFRQFHSLKILVSSKAVSPFSCRTFFGPRIVIPSELLGKKPDYQNVLRHELQHFRQYDLYWSWAHEVLKVMFWLNPAIYFWTQDLAELSELVCDEEVLHNTRALPEDYGKTLIQVAEFSINPQLFYSATTRMSGSQKKSSALLRRITMLQKSKKQMSKWWSLAHGTTAFAALFMVALLTRVEAKTTKIKTQPQLQKILENSLQEGIEKSDAEEGFAILSNPNTGEILAVSQLQFSEGEFIQKKEFSFLHDPYDANSIFKPIVAAIAIENGAVNESTVLDATSNKIEIDGRKFYDWKTHGKITVQDTIANSSNIGSYRMIENYSDVFLYKQVKQLGFGEGGTTDGTGFSSPGDIQRSKGTDRAFNHIHLAYGVRSVKVTALEILQAYAAFANGGQLMKPRSYGSSPIPPIKKIFSDATREQINRALRKTVTQGTAKRLSNSKYNIAGKTGTGRLSASSDLKTAMFIGTAPYEMPKLVAYAIILKKGETYGAKDAAPIVRSILERGLDYLE